MCSIVDLPVVDKLAVVHYGIVGGTVWRNGVGDPVNISECRETMYYNILRHYDCDVFMHSWSYEHRDQLLEVYNPKSHLIEPQEMFGFAGDQLFNSEGCGNNFRSTSYWNSIKRAVVVKKEYEIQQGFRYKWVLVTRLDLAYFTKLDLDGLDNRNFYLAQEPFMGVTPGANRFWDYRVNLLMAPAILFLSSSDNIDKFSLISDKIAAGEYKDILWVSEAVVFRELCNILHGDLDKIQYVYRRFYDLDIYRTIVSNFSNGREADFMHYCLDHGINLLNSFNMTLQEARWCV